MLSAIRQGIGMAILLCCGFVAYIAIKLMGTNHVPMLVRRPEPTPAPPPGAAAAGARPAVFH